MQFAFALAMALLLRERPRLSSFYFYVWCVPLAISDLVFEPLHNNRWVMLAVWAAMLVPAMLGPWLACLVMAVVIPATGFLLQRFHVRQVFITAMTLFSVGTLDPIRDNEAQALFRIVHRELADEAQDLGAVRGRGGADGEVGQDPRPDLHGPDTHVPQAHRMPGWTADQLQRPCPETRDPPGGPHLDRLPPLTSSPRLSAPSASPRSAGRPLAFTRRPRSGKPSRVSFGA